MLTKQDQYNQNLERLAKADTYFQTQFQSDTEEGKAWAIKTLKQLIMDQEKLYAFLRPHSISTELQNGFTETQHTLEFDIETETNIIERLDIIRSEGWTINKFEYLNQSKKILIGLQRK